MTSWKRLLRIFLRNTIFRNKEKRNRVLMNDIADLPKRTYEEINKNRRRLLELGFSVFPEMVACDSEEFIWDNSIGRANIHDLFYLHEKNYIRVTAVDPLAGHKIPIFYKLTATGIDLLEKPGEIDIKFPIINISGTHGNVTVGNGNIVNSAVNDLDEIRKIILHLNIPESEKKNLLDRILSLASLLGPAFEIGKTLLAP
jgi:hypothetical protein